MTTYILNCLYTQKWIVYSWGFNTPTKIKNGLRFSVNGFIHKGLVDVIIDEGKDLYIIKLIKNNIVGSLISDVSVDELVYTLDCLIEKVENYDERVKKEYNFI